MANLFKKVFAFFAHPDTPGSGFYLAVLPVIGSVGDYFLGSGNPMLMAIGGGIAAVYAAANAFSNAIQAKASPTVAGTPTVNDTPFGTPKVGPDMAPPASSVQVPDEPSATPSAAAAAAQAEPLPGPDDLAPVAEPAPVAPPAPTPAPATAADPTPKELSDKLDAVLAHLAGPKVPYVPPMTTQVGPIVDETTTPAA